VNVRVIGPQRHREYIAQPMPTGPFVDLPASGFVAAAWMVAKRDMAATLRSKSFVISSVVILLLLLVSFFVASLTGAAGQLRGTGPLPTIELATTPDLTGVVGAISSVKITQVENRGDAIGLVRSGRVEAAILAPSGPGGAFEIVGDESVPSRIESALTTTPKVTLLNPPRLEEMARYFLALAFGVVYMTMGLMFGQMIATNTVVEKQTRIVEILLAAVPARAMLAGKIVGGSILAVGDTVLIVGVCFLGMQMNGLSDLLTLLTAPMWWYVAFFIVGFVMYASTFTAAGALVSRIEDLGSAAMPIMLMVMAPYVLVMALNGSPVAMSVMSYVPFTAPVAMPIQMVVGEAGTVQALISLVILLGTAALIGLGATKIYTNSVLRTGSRIKLGQALSGRGTA
jgi:ABC-2 type transport system permease protein